jgi:uncharacterized protein (TIGR03437 family)
MRAILLHAILNTALTAQSNLYTIETFAGTAWSGDGRPAKEAVLVQPQGLTADRAGNVYVSDASDHRIRRITPAGIIDTVAGTGVAGYRGDGGPASKALLRSPYGLAVDHVGNVFVADLGNACVRRIAPDGTIQTVAGGGTQAFGAGAVITAVKARLLQPRDVAVDQRGNLFIADFGAHYVYQVTPDGVLSVIAGTGQPGKMAFSQPAATAPLDHPAALAVDPVGALYIADSGNRRVRRLAGGWLWTVHDGTGREMEFGTPTGLDCDSMGRLFVADGAAQTTLVFPNGGFAALAIGGTAVTVRGGIDVFTISERSVLRLAGGTSEVFAGGGSGPGAGDGYNRNMWRFNAPSSIVRDRFGYLYIADTGNGRIRRILPSGELQTVTTRLPAPIALALDGQSRLHAAYRITGAVYRVDAAGGVQVVAEVENRPMKPAALAFDKNDNLFIADEGNHLIRRVTPGGAFTVVAGGGSQINDGVALLQKLGGPAGLQFDAQGDLWFTEAATGRLRKLSGGRVTTVAGAEMKEPRGLRIEDSGDLLVADAGLHRVIRVSPSGEWTPLAGTGDAGYSGDGETALGAMLNRPSDVLLESGGTLLVADTANNRIRRLRPAPVVETIQPPAAITMPLVDVLHGATLKREPVAPGQIVYVTGKALPMRPRVTFDDVAGLVLAESDQRITLLVPRELREGVSEVTVWAGETVHSKAPVDIAAAAPAVLTSDGTGGGPAIASNEDGVRNGLMTPAARGSIVTLYLTGEGNAPGTVRAQIGGYAADVVWAGPAPNLPGVYQVNVRTPGGFSPSGTVDVVMTVGAVRTRSGVSIVSR